MIWDSSYWKEPLLASARYLNRVRIGDRTSERTIVRIEKEVLLGFYSVRRLIESRKVTDSTSSRIFDVAVHLVKKRPEFFNWHRLDDYCDLDNTVVEQRDLTFLCNQFIHSYVLLIAEKEGRFAGVHVASDRQRHSRCYYVTRKQIVLAFRSAGNDYPARLQFSRNSDGQIDLALQ